MSVNETLAHASNDLVYSAMAVYTVALAAWAVDLAELGEQAGRRRAAAPARAAAARAGASSGAVTGGASGASTGAGTRAATPARATARVGGSAGVAVAEAPASLERPASPGRSARSADRPPSAPLGPGRRRAAGIATSLTLLGLLLHAGGVVARGLAADRAPWGNMYEFTVTGSAVVVAVYLAVLARRDVRYLGAFVVGPVLLALGLAVTVLYTADAQLVPALQSYWLVIHVTVAFVSSALFTIAFSTTVLQLVQERREVATAAGSPPRGGRFMDALPTSTELERTSYRLIAISFPLWGFTLVAGAIWAEVAWGRYWNWDPKEVWTLIIWIVYAAYLHARATGGWGGRRAAYVALAAYACILINWGIVNVFIPGEHSYAGIG